jgi:hypothetical protein
MPEAELEEHIRYACKQVGVIYVHHRRSQETEAGFPDDVLIGPRGVLWRENKRTGYDPTPAQRRVLDALTEAGQDVAVWRPVDLLSGRVSREIAAISRLGARITNTN